VTRVKSVAIIAVSFFISVAVAHADENSGSVMVGVVRLEPSGPVQAGARLAVRVYIGSKLLYRTPSASGVSPRWGNYIRACTALSNPLVFEVMELPRDAGRGPGTNRRARSVPEEQDDEVLSTVLDDLVVDYGPAERKDEDRERDNGTSGRVFEYHDAGTESGLMCRAVLKWPPGDGEHRLECGRTTLIVTSRWLGKQCGRGGR